MSGIHYVNMNYKGDKGGEVMDANWENTERRMCSRKKNYTTEYEKREEVRKRKRGLS